MTPEKVAEIESMHQQAIDALLRNDFQTALRSYSDILLLEPDDETAYTGLGQIYMVQGRYNYAHEAFENALHINPANEVALAGIRKIMDPDGVEGMTSQTEMRTEEVRAAYLPPPQQAPVARQFAVEQIPVSLPAVFSGMEKRQSAVKAKKGTGAPASARPAIASPAPAPAPRIVRIRYAPMPGRLGLLHAQRTQMALKNAGFYEGPVNGMVGDKTKSALREFQKTFGIQPSGRITPVTWTKLSEYLAF